MDFPTSSSSNNDISSTSDLIEDLKPDLIRYHSSELDNIEDSGS
jgi:hypothetical protein